MPVNRHASGTRMLMGSIARGDEGGGAGDWKGITVLLLINGDGTVGRAPPRRVRLSRFVLRYSTRRLCANACFPAPGCLQRGPLDPLGCLRTPRHAHVKQRVLGQRRSVTGQPRLPGRRSSDRPDTGSVLPIRARLIGRSRHFRLPNSSPKRVRCAASKSGR